VPSGAVAAVNSALSSLAMTITLSAPTQSRDGGTVSYDAGSLLVLWKPPGSANTFTASLGGSRLVAGASGSSPYVQLPLPSGVVPIVTPAPPLAAAPVAPGLPGQPVPVGPLAPGPVTASQPPAPVALEPLASGTPAPTWSVVLTVIGAALLLGGSWRVPGLILVEPRPNRCPLEEDLP
jgi:hypothetical protein